MPRVDWGIDKSDVDEFDRDSQFSPYRGPIPANGVYEWVIKTLRYVAGDKTKHPSLWVGLELESRGPDEDKIQGYFIMCFLPITPKTQFRYVPFLDAIGVSGRDFTDRTIVDENGNIKKIGQWRNSGEEMIAAQLRDGTDAKGNPQKEISWFGPLDEDESDEDEPLDDDDYAPVDEDEDEDDEDLEF